MTPLEAINLLDSPLDGISHESDIDNIEYDMQDVVEAIQCLIDTGTIYHLQGSYQRLAQDMLDEGLVTSLFNHI